MSIIVNNVRGLIKQTVDPQQAERLEPLAEAVQMTMGEIRDVSHRLHPHQLDRLGLSTAIESVAQHTLGAAGVR